MYPKSYSLFLSFVFISIQCFFLFCFVILANYPVCILRLTFVSILFGFTMLIIQIIQLILHSVFIFFCFLTFHCLILSIRDVQPFIFLFDSLTMLGNICGFFLLSRLIEGFSLFITILLIICRLLGLKPIQICLLLQSCRFCGHKYLH